jgi:hypothetical protein
MWPTPREHITILVGRTDIILSIDCRRCWKVFCQGERTHCGNSNWWEHFKCLGGMISNALGVVCEKDGEVK